RLAEALRAQASLGARPTAAAPATPVVHKPTPPKRGVPKGGGPRDGRTPVRVGTPGGQSGPHGRGASAGHHQSGPQRAAPRPQGAPLAPAGRGSGSGPHRPGDDQLPTTRVTPEPGAEAPTTVASPAQPGPARPLPARPAAGAAPATRAALLLDARL